MIAAVGTPSWAAQRLADFSRGLTLDAVPPDVLTATRWHLLDALGCGLAAHALGVAPYATSTLEPGSRGAASAIGVSHGVPVASAALCNGIQCHALDFDDTHAGSIAHVSAVVAPAAMAAAEGYRRSFGELLLALVIGNEVTCRVGTPVGDAFHRRGLHPTAICGVFGATAAVARLGALDRAGTISALGIAGSMASGLLAYLADGSDTKRVHPGWMAHAAQFAVELARGGASGPASVLEGTNGIYQAFLDRRDVTAIADDLGAAWETVDIAFKPYPVCHFMHAALDAVEAATRDGGIDAGRIERITVLMPQAGIDMVCSPSERKRRPGTPYEAKFSAPFCIGALLARGTVGVTTFTEPALEARDILAIAAKVDHEVCAYDTFPGSFPAGVRLALSDGTVVERHLLHQRGAAENPMSADDVAAKFEANASLALPPHAVAQLRRDVLGDGADAGLRGLRVLRDASTAEAVP